jgi:glycosyltransferase involved in cell wall biosynthesis
MRVLYVSPNPIGSALVRSQVLPYLRGLTLRGHDLRLLTFERGPTTRAIEFDPDRSYALRAMHGGSLAAKLVDIVRGMVLAARIVLSHRVKALHARSYLPAAICWAVGMITGRPYVFDMRGFLGEEYVDGGRWTTNDVRYRALRWAEGVLLRDAAEIVVLTEAAADRLRNDERYARWVGGRPVSVIPCAVDLERFRPVERRLGVPILVYSGSLGMSYLIQEMLRVYLFACEHLPSLRMRLLNRGEHALIRRAIARVGADPARIELRSADHAEMPRALAESHVAIALLQQVPSKMASSPIKITEYLACGLPTIVNAGLGDSDRLVARYGAGHVVETFTEDELRRAGAAVARLAGDDAARRNARRLAEEIYALDLAVDRYAQVYERLDRGTNGRIRLAR